MRWGQARSTGGGCERFGAHGKEGHWRAGRLRSSDEFVDDAAAVDDGDWAAVGGDDFVFGIDAQQGEEGCGEIFRSVGIFGGVLGPFVALADDPAAVDAAAAEHDREAAAPMVAPGVLVDFGRATEFAGDEDEGFFVEAAVLEVAKEGGHGHVELGEKLVAEDFEIGVVGVPVGVIDGDAADAGFDHAPRHDAGLAEGVAAVGIAEFFGFGGEIEGALCSGRGHEVEGALAEDAVVFGAGVGGDFGGALVAVDLAEEFAAGLETGGVDDKGRRHVGDGEVGGAGVGFDDEGDAGGAEVGGPAAGVHVGKADVGRDAAARAEFVADVGTEGGVLVVGLEAAVEAGGGMMPGEHVMISAAVVGISMGEGANLGELLHDAGDAREVFADSNAGEVGGDGAEVAADVGGSVGLEVEGVDGAQAALEEDVDEGEVGGNGFGGGVGGGVGLQLQETGEAERQADEAGGAEAEEVASIRAGTGAGGGVHRWSGSVVENEFEGIEEAPGKVFGGFAALAGAGLEVLHGGLALGGGGETTEAGEVEFVGQLGVVGGGFHQAGNGPGGVGEFVVDFGGIEQVQDLGDAGVGLAFAFAGGGAKGAAEDFEEVMFHVAVPDLGGAVAGGDAVKFLGNAGDLADGVEEHFGGESAEEGAGVVLFVGFVGVVGAGGELVGARGGECADDGFEVEALIEGVFGEGVEEFGIAGGVGQACVVHGFDEATAKEMGDEAVDEVTGEPGVVRGGEPFG